MAFGRGQSGMPIRVMITKFATEDATQADHLIKGLDPEELIADRGDGTNAIIEQAAK
jgi:hypothetical protein